MTQMRSTVNVKDLSVHFKGRRRFFGKRGPSGGTWALRSLSFSLGQGETLSVVGESGSGKTTLLRSLL